MTNFAVDANGTFWGVFAAETKDDAIQMAADMHGTDGNTDGMTARMATDDETAEWAR